jgi:hypothetical protein
MRGIETDQAGVRDQSRMNRGLYTEMFFLPGMPSTPAKI